MVQGIMHLFLLLFLVFTQASILQARPGAPGDGKEGPSHNNQALGDKCKKWTSEIPTACKASVAFPFQPHRLATALINTAPLSMRRNIASPFQVSLHRCLPFPTVLHKKRIQAARKDSGQAPWPLSMTENSSGLHHLAPD
ncbi:hypothetical protein FA10DRAFT_290823, partial [Acaromyces ingoldii]